MISIQRLRGGPANGKVVKIDTDRPFFKVAVPSVPATICFNPFAKPPVTDTIETVVYERVRFVTKNKEAFYRYYHPDHFEADLMKRGMWNKWFWGRIRQHEQRKAKKRVQSKRLDGLLIAAICLSDHE